MKAARFADTVGPDQLSRALAGGQDVRLLDVRTATEFSMSRLDGSRNVPLAQLGQHAEALSAARAPIVIVCRSGVRAHTAAGMLRGKGMRNVSVLDGGLIAWRQHGLPVARDPISLGALLRRAMGVVGLVIAAFSWRQNPMLAALLGFLGLRMVMGMSAMPCAVAGTCAVPGSTPADAVRDLVQGPPAPAPVAGEPLPADAR